MKRAARLLPVLLVLSPMASAAAERVSSKALIAAAKVATISQIDYTRRDCGDDRRFEDWLKAVVADNAKSITWSAGKCRLVNNLSGIDSGSGWCARAEIMPKRGRDKATVEINFEAPRHGRPGEPFAFRGLVHLKEGWDYMRDTSAFAEGWRVTYAPDAPALEPAGNCD